MTVIASISDKEVHRGVVYATTMKPIGKAPLVECLRPTRDLAHVVKYQGKSDRWYDEGYRALLQSRWPAVRAWLDGLAPDRDETLVCYCRPGAYCHRYLIARLLLTHRWDIPLLVR